MHWKPPRGCLGSAANTAHPLLPGQLQRQLPSLLQSRLGAHNNRAIALALLLPQRRGRPAAAARLHRLGARSLQVQLRAGAGQPHNEAAMERRTTKLHSAAARVQAADGTVGVGHRHTQQQLGAGLPLAQQAVQRQGQRAHLKWRAVRQDQALLLVMAGHMYMYTGPADKRACTLGRGCSARAQPSTTSQTHLQQRGAVPHINPQPALRQPARCPQPVLPLQADGSRRRQPLRGHQLDQAGSIQQLQGVHWRRSHVSALPCSTAAGGGVRHQAK